MKNAIIVRTETKKFNNGEKLGKRLFLKLINTIDFELYLMRYCKILKDERTDFTRVFFFQEYGYTIEAHYYLGEFKKLRYYN